MSGAWITLAESANRIVATDAEVRGQSAIQPSIFNQRCLMVRRIRPRVYLHRGPGVVRPLRLQ